MKKGYLIFFLIFNFNFLGVSQNFQWGSILDGGSQKMYAMETDSLKNVYVTGFFSASTDFDPGSAVVNLIPSSHTSAYLAKYDSLGTLIWAKQITGTNDVILRDLKVDYNFNVYVTGRIQGTIDMDPGPGADSITASGYSNIIIAKYDVNGDLIWAEALGGNNFLGSGAGKMELIGSDIIIAGEFYKTVDFDPGIGTFNLTCPDSLLPEIFFARYNNSGDFVWAKAIANAQLFSITVDVANNLYITGIFADSLDVDPNAGVSWLVNTIYNPMFFAKYNSSGALIWGKMISGSVRGKIKVDDSLNTYLAGDYQGTADFDPGSATYLLNVPDSLGNIPDVNYSSFIARYDSMGNFNWVVPIASQSMELITDLSLDNSGNIYVGGTSMSNYLDFDPGIGINEISGSNLFFAKYDPYGKLFWVKNIQDSIVIFGQSIFYPPLIKVQSDGDIFYAAEFIGSVDLDPGIGVSSAYTPLGTSAISISKFHQDVCSSGLLEIASENDFSCSNNGSAAALLTGAVLPYMYAWNTFPVINSDTLTTDSIGLFQVTVVDANSCSYSRKVNVEGPDNVSNFDLEAHLTSHPYNGWVGTDLISTFEIDAYNNTCPPISGVLTFILDTLLTFSNAIPSPSTISGDTLRWNFSNMNYYSGHLTPHIEATSSNGIDEVDTIHLEIFIDPIIADIDTTNNHYTSTEFIQTYIEVGTSQSIIQEKNFFDVYPNPFTDKVSVVTYGESPDRGTINITNSLGEVVYSTEVKNKKEVIDMSHQPGGLYFVKFESKDKLYTKKIIKY